MEGGNDKKLTDKQKRFCEEYVIDWNGTRAAKAAGYSEKSARQVASDTLSKTYIQAYIKEYQKNLSKATGVTAIRNIKELAKVAYTNISDFKKDWFTFKEWSDLDDDQKAAIAEITHSEINISEDVVKIVEKVKTHDKLKAIAMLNKMLGFDQVEPEPIEQTNNLTVVIGANGIEELPNEEDQIEDFTVDE